MSLNELATEAYQISRDHGFWDGDVDVNVVLAKMALIHSEVSEALEAVRKSKGERAVVEELSDIIVRTVDLYAALKDTGWVESDLSEVYADKVRFNASRPYKHNNLA